MRECYSGDIFITTFYRQNEESFLEGIVKGLEHFGGTPQNIIFDNARVAVKEGFGHHASRIEEMRGAIWNRKHWIGLRTRKLKA